MLLKNIRKILEMDQDARIINKILKLMKMLIKVSNFKFSSTKIKKYKKFSNRKNFNCILNTFHNKNMK
jgi:hypothetical protein